jgi:hypothetical protein
LALKAIRPGLVRYANEYPLALPRRLVEAMSTAATKDDVPPF